MLNSLNQFHLTYIPTAELEKLRAEIAEELSARRKAKKLKDQKLAVLAPSTYVDISKPEVELHNSSSILSIPGNYGSKTYNCVCFLDALINQDWSHLYCGGDETKKYYVYAHVDPSKPHFQSSNNTGGNWGGQPFYIGKGTGNRAFEMERNQGHGKIIRLVKNAGFSDNEIAKILISNLSESKAFEIEAKLIYFFGTIYDKTLKRKGVLYNLTIPTLPEFEGEMIDYRKVESSVEDYATFESRLDLWHRKHPLATENQKQQALKRIAMKYGVKLSKIKSDLYEVKE